MKHYDEFASQQSDSGRTENPIVGWVIAVRGRRIRSAGRCRLLFFFLVLLCLVFCCTAAAQDTVPGTGLRPAMKPRIVYIDNFLLDVQAEKGKDARGPLQVRKRLKDRVETATGEDPRAEAEKIVNALAQSIVKELNEKKVTSARFPGPGSVLSYPSWLVEGEFVEYDEGDRLKRAIIGFGSGSATMEVNMKLTEITEGDRRLIFDSSVEGKKQRMPGAVVTKNPYVAGAKFVLSKGAPEKEITKLGARIAEELVEFMKKEGFVQP